MSLTLLFYSTASFFILLGDFSLSYVLLHLCLSNSPLYPHVQLGLPLSLSHCRSLLRTQPCHLNPVPAVTPKLSITKGCSSLLIHKAKADFKIFPVAESRLFNFYLFQGRFWRHILTRRKLILKTWLFHPIKVVHGEFAYLLLSLELNSRERHRMGQVSLSPLTTKDYSCTHANHHHHHQCHYTPTFTTSTTTAITTSPPRAISSSSHHDITSINAYHMTTRSAHSSPPFVIVRIPSPPFS